MHKVRLKIIEHFCSVVFMGVAVQRFKYFREPSESVWKTNKQMIQDLLYCFLVLFQHVSVKCQTDIPACTPHFFRYLREAYRDDGSRHFFKVHSDNGERQWTPVAIWENPIRYKEIFSP